MRDEILLVVSILKFVFSYGNSGFIINVNNFKEYINW